MTQKIKKPRLIKTPFPHAYVTDEQVDDLAKEFGFSDSFDLKSELLRAFTFTLFARLQRGELSSSRQREFLEELERRCADMADILKTLHGKSRKRLLSHLPEEIDLRRLHKLKVDISKVGNAASAAVADMKGKKGKRSKGEIWTFVPELADIYEEGTGKKVKTGYVTLATPPIMSGSS